MDLERAHAEWKQGLESQVRSAIELTSTLRTSTSPEWQEARRRLEAEGVPIDEAALYTWHTSGEHSDTAILGTTSGRVFVFDILFDYGPECEPLEKGVRCVGRWEEVTDKAKIVERWQLPNIYLTAVIIARRLAEAGSGSGDAPRQPE